MSYKRSSDGFFFFAGGLNGSFRVWETLHWTAVKWGDASLTNNLPTVRLSLPQERSIHVQLGVWCPDSHILCYSAEEEPLLHFLSFSLPLNGVEPRRLGMKHVAYTSH